MNEKLINYIQYDYDQTQQRARELSSDLKYLHRQFKYIQGRINSATDKLYNELADLHELNLVLEKLRKDDLNG